MRIKVRVRVRVGVRVRVRVRVRVSGGRPPGTRIRIRDYKGRVRELGLG